MITVNELMGHITTDCIFTIYDIDNAADVFTGTYEEFFNTVMYPDDDIRSMTVDNIEISKNGSFIIDAYLT